MAKKVLQNRRTQEYLSVMKKIQQQPCMETLIQQEMKILCKKMGVVFTQQYYEDNRDLYTTFILGKLNQKIIADKIIQTFNKDKN